MLPTERCLFSRGGALGSCWHIRVIFVFWGEKKSPAFIEEIAGEQLTCWRCEDTRRCTVCQCLGIRSIRGSAGVELMHQEIAFSIFVGEMQLT